MSASPFDNARRFGRHRGAPLGRLVLFAVLLAPTPALSEVNVQIHGNQVDLRASAAPLAELLSRLAKQTGMELVFEGPAPRQLVTLTIRGRTPADTVQTLFEGLGVNYALSTDSTGTNVRKLLVTTATAPRTATAVRPVPDRPIPRRPTTPPEPDLEPELEPELPFDEIQPSEEDPAATPPGAPGGVLPRTPREESEGRDEAGQPVQPATVPQISPYPRAIPYAPGPFARPSEPAASPPADGLPTAPIP